MHGSMDFDSPPQPTRVIELPGSDIQREGFLKKLKTNKKKYFVLRSTSSSGPARLEYYDSEKKLKMGHPPKKSIKLHNCFNINKKNDTRQKFAIALHTKDECFSVVADDAVEQELWLNLLLKLQNEYLPAGEYPKPHYDHVWQVSVKPKGLGISKAICGDYRLCLSEKEICMVKKNSDKPEFSFQLGNIRRCGNTDNFFFMEVGRQSPTGPGDLYMQLEDNYCAQNIHEEVLNYMRKNSSGGNFRQRSSTGSSATRPPQVPDGENDAARKRSQSDGKKSGGSPRKDLHNRRPQSVATLPSGMRSPGSDSYNETYLSGFYSNIPSTFAPPRDRSDSSSSRASSHKSLPPDFYGSSPEPVYENTKDNPNRRSIRSMTPDLVPPIYEESTSSYMDMSPKQTSLGILENTQYLDMVPGQQSTKPHSVSPNLQSRSPNLQISPSTPRSDMATERSYMAMSPGQYTPENKGSSYMAMSPGQLSGTMATLPGHQHGNRTSSQDQQPMATTQNQHSAPYSPSSQRGSRPDTPPSQRASRPGSSCSQDSSVNSSEGYTEMNPAEQSKSIEKVNIEPGYIDMTVGSSSSTSSKDGSPKLSRTAPIPIRSTKQPGYLEMTPTSQPLAPVKEGGSGEGYLPMAPHYNSPFSDSNLRPHKVVSYLSDDSMSGEFPKRAYSVGSRPQRKLIQHLHHLPVNKPNMSNNGRSSSAPHLIEKKLKGMMPYTTMDSSLSCSPSQSIKSSVSDSDSFIEMDYIRPRTSSDSFGCRPRSSSFGKVFVQSHRPRSSSYGTSARGKLGSFESVRLTSKELHMKQSNESLTGQISGASSSESLKKTDPQQKGTKISEYVDMRLDKSESPGYIDMTVNPKNVGHTSSSSLSSSPAIANLTSPIRHDTTSSSPSIKIIMPSGKTQSPVGFPTPTSTTVGGIPPQSSLFSPINFVSPSGSRSPSVKGRSPVSSGRESEDEAYLSYQPATSESVKDEKKTEHKKERKSWHSKNKHKDKNKKLTEDKKHGRLETSSNKGSDSYSGISMQEMKMDRDSMYMDFEPGAIDISEPVESETNSIQFSLGPCLSQSTSGSDITVDLSQNQTVPESSPYMEYEPEIQSTKSDSDLNVSIVSDDSAYMQYEPGEIQQRNLTQEQTIPSIPPRKFEGTNLKLDAAHNIGNNSCGSSVETLKDGGSATHVDLDPYMDFDPDDHDDKHGDLKMPSRVRSFITDTSMEEELGKDTIVSGNQSDPIKGNSSNISDSGNKSKVIDAALNDKSVLIKSVIKPLTVSSPIDENDEYVGLEFNCKSSERLLLGGISPGVQTITHDKLMENKNSKFDDVFKNDKMKTDFNDRKPDARSTNISKGSVLSLEELKIEETPTSNELQEAKHRKISVSSKTSASLHEITKQGSLTCMNLPAEILDLQIKEKSETENSSQNSRNSCSDLTVSYECMNFPSDTLKSSELSSSQQQLTAPGLNYASLDLGSRENIDLDTKLQQVKSRHSSSADEASPLPPNSYAQIDFKMSETLKNLGKQDSKSSFE